MIKTKKRVKVAVRGKDKTKSKVVFPTRTYSRLQVCLAMLKGKEFKLGKTYDLSKVKGFCEDISSRAFIGRTTRAGLLKAGYKVECIKSLANKSLWSIVRFSR